MQQIHGLSIPQTLEETCDPRTTALLVYDMQIGVVSQLKNGDQITAGVKTVLEAARASGMRVFFSRHLSLPTELMGVFQYRMGMVWQRAASPAEVKPWFTRDAPGFQIVPELAPLPSEGIFDKLAMSAFEGTYLNMALRDCGINSFLICGVATEIGIEPTVRHGADLGLIPIVIEDACGAGNTDAAARSMEGFRFTGDAIVTDVAAICRALG